MSKLKKSIENGDQKMSKITMFNMGWCRIYELRTGCYNKGAIKEQTRGLENENILNQNFENQRKIGQITILKSK